MRRFPRLTESLARAFTALVTEFPEEQQTVEEYVEALLVKKRTLRASQQPKPKRWKATGASVIRPPVYFWKYKTTEPLK